MASLQFLFQVGKQIGMHLGIDLATQDALGTGDSEQGDLVTQFFLGALGGCGGFTFGGFACFGNDAASFGASVFVDNLAACFSAAPRTSPADSRALRSSSTTFFSASARSALALSAAASPSAILPARSSSAFMIGGHTNFIVNQPRMKNTTIWAIRVAFRFTV
jgi:hypothetical protein